VTKRIILVLLLVSAAVARLNSGRPQSNDAARLPAVAAPETSYVGNDACARCHEAISESYSHTSMAHASGLATDEPRTVDFVDPGSRVHYRIFSDAGQLWLSFERPGDNFVNGKRKLLYFVGSGRRGLTYLFAVDGFLFESPINWYGDKKLWDMAPAYQGTREIPLNLPAFTSCLYCHVGDLQPPLPGTENRYAMPFQGHGGVTCERCHGPGASHVKGGPIVNPAHLPADRRDAICMQCHLEGKIAVERPGVHLSNYKPGDDLSTYVRYFVLSDLATRDLGAVSQVEALAQSTCKQKAGDSMSCTSCHDPHSEPSPENKVAYYRKKCLSCHGASFAEKHHPNQADCAGCHMPASRSTDVAHTQVTDHRILRRHLGFDGVLQSAGDPELVPFPRSEQVDLRDRTLAWQMLAQKGDAEARGKAERLLRQAVMNYPDDPAVLAELGYVEQQHGRIDSARALYQRAITRDPDTLDVAIDLAVLEASSGHLGAAVKLWQSVFARAPYRSNVGLNLAEAFCKSGQYDSARSYLLRVLEFDPDSAHAKLSLQRLNQVPPACGP
jgi:predicted CXXCH cytochrome family protein